MLHAQFFKITLVFYVNLCLGDNFCKKMWRNVLSDIILQDTIFEKWRNVQLCMQIYYITNFLKKWITNSLIYVNIEYGKIM